MSLSVNIHTDRLLQSLREFPQNVQKNILSGAVRAGAKPIIAEARDKVSKRSGVLAKSIGVNKRRTRNRNILWFSVSPRRGAKRKNDGWYAHMVEFGHDVVRDKKVIGYSPPVPFMRTAFENQSEESLMATKEYLQKRIDKEIARSRGT